MKVIFFKAVRRDGRSIYVRGKFSRIYKIGERYTFPKGFPAHVFTRERNVPDGCSRHRSFWELFHGRPESNYCCRVLICWGELMSEYVPVARCGSVSSIDFGGWGYEARFVSYDFEVIGEIFPGQSVFESDPKLHDVEIELRQNDPAH